MNEALKKQILGATVLLMAGVILLPPILDGKGYYARHPVIPTPPPLPSKAETVVQATQTIIPPVPVVAPTIVETPSPLAPQPSNPTPAAAPPTLPIAVTPSLEPMPKPKPLTPKPPPPVPPTLKPEKAAPLALKKPPAPVINTDLAWKIQAGNFEQQDNAQKLQQALSQRGYRAQINPDKKGNKTHYRVQLGPFRSREQADAMRLQINKQLGLTSFITN